MDSTLLSLLQTLALLLSNLQAVLLLSILSLPPLPLPFLLILSNQPFLPLLSLNIASHPPSLIMAHPPIPPNRSLLNRNCTSHTKCHSLPFHPLTHKAQCYRWAWPILYHRLPLLLPHKHPYLNPV